MNTNVLSGVRALLRLLVMGLLLAVGGCSSEQSPSQGAGEATDVAKESPAATAPPAATATFAPPSSETAAVEGAAGSAVDAQPLSEKDQLLLKEFSDPSPDVRADAVDEIEASGAALEPLARLAISDPAPEVREAALSALKESDDPGAVDVLIPGLDVEDPEVLMEVIEALWFIEDRRAVPHLQGLLDHPNEQVREAAEFALDNFK
jgi:HEAT repeat protein